MRRRNLSLAVSRSSVRPALPPSALATLRLLVRPLALPELDSPAALFPKCPITQNFASQI
eukprot:80934-Pleurochrysis_carterae.AAC.1